MKNNYWEEQNMKQEILDFHQEVIESMEVPEWVKINCPHCSEKVELRGIRAISLCLNARNLGDLAVQYHCSKCGLMDTVYFRKSVDGKVSNFAKYIKDKEMPDQPPVVEEEMYKLRYNNLMDKFIKEKKI